MFQALCTLGSMGPGNHPHPQEPGHSHGLLFPLPHLQAELEFPTLPPPFVPTIPSRPPLSSNAAITTTKPIAPQQVPQDAPALADYKLAGSLRQSLTNPGEALGLGLRVSSASLRSLQGKWSLPGTTADRPPPPPPHPRPSTGSQGRHSLARGALGQWAVPAS